MNQPEPMNRVAELTVRAAELSQQSKAYQSQLDRITTTLTDIRSDIVLAPDSRSSEALQAERDNLTSQSKNLTETLREVERLAKLTAQMLAEARQSAELDEVARQVAVSNKARETARAELDAAREQLLKAAAEFGARWATSNSEKAFLGARPDLIARQLGGDYESQVSQVFERLRREAAKELFDATV